MIDYANKARVLDSGLPKIINTLDKKRYIERRDYGVIRDINSTLDFDEMMLTQQYGQKDIDEARKINNASYHRQARLKERIAHYLTMGKCLFLTLTFSDSTLEKTNEETRKKYIKNYLKSQSAHYVANIDFGKTNHREHYHALIVGEKVDYNLWHKYGAIDGEKVRLKDKTDVKLSKYISKLTNHAIKETTKRSCYIYSR